MCTINQCKKGGRVHCRLNNYQIINYYQLSNNNLNKKEINTVTSDYNHAPANPLPTPFDDKYKITSKSLFQISPHFSKFKILSKNCVRVVIQLKPLQFSSKIIFGVKDINIDIIIEFLIIFFKNWHIFL